MSDSIFLVGKSIVGHFVSENEKKLHADLSYFFENFKGFLRVSLKNCFWYIYIIHPAFLKRGSVYTTFYEKESKLRKTGALS